MLYLFLLNAGLQDEYNRIELTLCNSWFTLPFNITMSQRKTERHKIEYCSPSQIHVETDAVESAELDWSLCFICQDEKKDLLISPANKNANCSPAEVYLALAKRIKRFQVLDMLPVDTYINNLEQNNDLCESLTVNCAMYHKFCVNKFSALKLAHA